MYRTIILSAALDFALVAGAAFIGASVGTDPSILAPIPSERTGNELLADGFRITDSDGRTVERFASLDYFTAQD
jgi:hypothetical protein